VPEGMRYAGGVSDEDADLEEYGYGHRQTTKDKGADVAARRKTYRFEAASRSNSPEEEAGPSSYRSRSKSRSRSRVDETPAPAPSRRRRSSRPPLSRSGRPPAPAAGLTLPPRKLGANGTDTPGKAVTWAHFAGAADVSPARKNPSGAYVVTRATVASRRVAQGGSSRTGIPTAAIGEARGHVSHQSRACNRRGPSDIPQPRPAGRKPPKTGRG
jgi:hypothetical protein